MYLMVHYIIDKQALLHDFYDLTVGGNNHLTTNSKTSCNIMINMGCVIVRFNNKLSSLQDSRILNRFI